MTGLNPVNLPRAENVLRPALSIRLARGADEVAAAQHLRYRVFYEECGAIADAATRASGRDADAYDAICDHLLVIDHDRGAAGLRLRDGFVVGTYRLLRQDMAEAHGGFYSAGEYDIAPLIARHPTLRFLELGRSCVLKAYRTRPVMELLWQGIWDYVRAHGMDVMMGCASFDGTDPQAHAETLAFLAQHAAAPPDWQVRALPGRYQAMGAGTVALDARSALKKLPPLIKAYLRLGCYIGDGAVIDHQFNTVDVLIILPVARIDPRYFAHFGAPMASPG